MSKQRALLLGADAGRSFLGARIEIGDCPQWEIKVICLPYCDLGKIQDVMELVLWSTHGVTPSRIPLRHGAIISGKTVQVAILRKIDGVDKVSVFLQEVV